MPSRWFLSSEERGNPDTLIDRRHASGLAWTTGNQVVPLVHGATYFADLVEKVSAMSSGDLLLFADWRSDGDERLVGAPGSEVRALFADAARRGVDVRGLVWRSHWDRLSFSGAENRRVEEAVNAAGGQVLLDSRVRTGGSHHQKFVVLRHREVPERDAAFVGGIDLCHSRRDDAEHLGDPQVEAMGPAYGPRPPWHDVQVRLHGPAVGDVEATFRERWDDPAPLTDSPVRWLYDQLLRDRVAKTPLPPQFPDPPAAGDHPVQVLRTYPRRRPAYPFAPLGERSVARAYAKALGRAQHLVYLEDQYLWSPLVADVLTRCLVANPGLHLVAVLPHHPDQQGRITGPPNLVSRQRIVHALRDAAPGRVALYGLENRRGTPVYVHAKACIVDDEWAAVGSDNLNRRSWTHDSELSVAVRDAGYARNLRDQLAREHLGLQAGEEAPGLDRLFVAFGAAAAALERWHDEGRVGTRPPGQLRPLVTPSLRWSTQVWAGVLYRVVYDPDGRPLRMRLRGSL